MKQNDPILINQPRTEEDLLLLETILDAAPIGFAYLDKDLKYRRINSFLAHLNGISIQDHIGKTMKEVIPWVKDEATKNLQKVLKSGKPILNREVTGYFLDKFSYPTWWSVSDYTIKNKMGEIIGVGVIQMDITDRKKNEEQLLFNSMVTQSLSEAIIATDNDYKILSWNKAAEKLFGWKIHEVLGKSARDIIKVQYLNSSREEWQKQMQKEGFWSGEVIQLRKDGKPITSVATTTTVKDSVGKIVGSVAIVRDITRQKEIDDELRVSGAFRTSSKCWPNWNF